MSDSHIDINMQGFASTTTQDVKTEKLKIRIPKRAWNAFQPRTYHTPSCTTSATRTRSKHKSGRRAAVKEGGRGTEVSPTSPKGCKVKVWKFQYGGPKHVVKGALQNEVTLASPCLRATCANCWKWHTHLMCRQEALVEPSERYVKHQADLEIEPTSPDIDPRILDGTWKVVDQSRRASAETIVSSALPEISPSTPTLTPVKISFPSCRLSPEDFSCPYEMTDEDSFRFSPDVFLPTSLMSEAVPTASMEYSRRSAHQRPRSTCLVFSSQAGKQGFRDCVRTGERKRKKAAYDRARRVKRKLKREQVQRAMSWGTVEHDSEG